MKRTVLLALLLGLNAIAWADDIELSDGRACKDCTLELKQGFAVSVKDKQGVEWLDPSKPMTVFLTTGSRWWPANKSYTSPAGAGQDTASEPSIYWHQRYLQFSNEMDLCASSTGDKAMCYLQVKQMEAQKDQAVVQNQLQAQQVNIIRSGVIQQGIQNVQALNLQQQSLNLQRQQQPTPRNFNCSTYGNNTNCNGY